MNRHDTTTMKTAGRLVGLTLVAAMGAALGCGTSGGSPTPGTGGTGTGGLGGTAGAAPTGTGGAGGAGGAAAGGSGGSAPGGGGGSDTGGSGGSADCGNTCLPASLPPTLNVPAGATVKFHLHGIGDQIYTCTASSAGGNGGAGGGGAGGSGATTYSFVLKQPDAKLYDTTNTQVGTHGLGPNWTSTVDGSVVNGAKVYQESSPAAGAVPWLLLRATSSSGTGIFSDVTYVQRVNTTGGAAPSTGCDSTTAGTDTRVGYTADYYFYAGGGPGTAWMTPPGSLPAAIAVPAGATLEIHDHAIGAQVYTCTASAAGGAGGAGGTGGAGGGATTYSWVLKQPDAVLYDSSFAQVGTHGLGPSWTSSDGSVVNGTKIAAANSTVTGAVPWLLLGASSNTGAGVFTDITYVQRLNTAGGAAPASGCDSSTSGMDTRVPYSGDYYFFTGGSSTDGGAGG
ncbi:MAG TPA: DUF3455 domain-containing protein [Polyangia bacterium]|nr:DUF3455 domain-containing protein [Polyangia bacterium]